MENNHVCIICGTAYHYCDDCGKMKTFTPWKTVCDTAEHYQIFTILNDLTNHRISNIEAKSMLDNIGIKLADLTAYKQSIQDILSPLFEINSQESASQSPIDNGMAKPKKTRKTHVVNNERDNNY